MCALGAELGCKTNNIINGGAQEVMELMHDVQVKMPHYIIGTVSDFDPRREEELEMRGILRTFLTKEGEKGVLLGMCFRPRNKRTLKTGRRLGWECVEVIGVIGPQVEEQCRLQAGA